MFPTQGSEKAVADIGVKVLFGSIEGVDNTGRNSEWEAERKVRLENLQKRFDGLNIHEDRISSRHKTSLESSQ